jgi:FkbM family methyltransferase
MLGTIKRWVLRCMPTSLAGRLRAWKIRRLIDTFQPRIVEHNFGGVRLKAYLADPLGEDWYDHDWEPVPEIRDLQPGKLRPGARVFDCGAHQAMVAAMLATVVGRSGQVVAVEASAHNCAIGNRNRELNNLPQIEIVNAAVSDKPGTLVFNEALNGQIDDGSGRAGCVSVEAVTIDGLADRFGFPDVVYIDIEGAECMAMTGASRVLESGTSFFVEVHVGHGLEKLGGSVEKLLSYFPGDKYELLVRSNEEKTFHPLLEDDAVLKDRFFLLALRK